MNIGVINRWIRAQLFAIWKLYKLAKRTIRRYGFVGAAKLSLTKVTPWVKRKKQICIDDFDELHGVDTAEKVRVDSLHVVGDNLDFGYNYSTIPSFYFRSLISLLNMNYEDWTFIDIGSGKGKILILAMEYPFKLVVGVEYTKELNEIAKKNIQIYTSHLKHDPAVKLVCTDAIQYEFPVSPIVIYFYNPFEKKIMDICMNNIIESLRMNPRTIYLMMLNIQYSLDFKGEFVLVAMNNPGEERYYSIYKSRNT